MDSTAPARDVAPDVAPHATPHAAMAKPFAPKNYVKTMPRWKKVLIGLGVVMLLVGLATLFVEDPAPPAATGSGGAGEFGGAGSTLVPGQESTGAAAQGESESAAQSPWSQAFLKFGFSFFVGMALGYAARAFLKFVLIFAGIFAAGLFLLSYYGFVTVEWDAMDEAFNGFTKAIQGQLGAFKTFITGSLPNAGLASLGLFTGFKKNG